MFMSVLVFPKSASHQATDNLKAGLIKLAELNGEVWKKGEDCTALSDIMHPATVSADCAHACLPTYRDHGHDLEAGDAEAKAWHDEEADHCCDQVCLALDGIRDSYALLSNHTSSHPIN